MVEIDEHRWSEDGVAEPSTARILQAVDALGLERNTRDRARTVGMGQVFVLLMGIALVLGFAVTLTQVITEAVAGIERGL